MQSRPKITKPIFPKIKTKTKSYLLELQKKLSKFKYARVSIFQQMAKLEGKTIFITTADIWPALISKTSNIAY